MPPRCIARARVREAMVKLNCAAFPATDRGRAVGYAKGASPVRSRRSRNGGAGERRTLFLDEIVDMPMDCKPLSAGAAGNASTARSARQKICRRLSALSACQRPLPGGQDGLLRQDLYFG